jgi:hypothetical protein
MNRSLVALVFAFVSGACATTGNAPPPATPGSQVYLTGTAWRLALSEGRLDGRTIEFKRGPKTYQAVLTQVGHLLDHTVGAHEGLVVMELVPAERPGQFVGQTRIPGQDESNVLCSVSSDGRAMKCNDENTPWTRVR